MHDQSHGIHEGKPHKHTQPDQPANPNRKAQAKLSARIEHYNKVLVPLHASNPSTYGFTKPGSLNVRNR